MTTSWYQIGYTVPSDQSDSYAEILAMLSGSGVCTDNRVVDTFSSDTIVQLASETITAFFPADSPLEQYLGAIEEAFHAAGIHGAPPPQIQQVGTEDWAHSWKQHFKPLPIGKTLIITPSWYPAGQDPKRYELRIDPGMAFGTGGHETTRLCLEATENLLPNAPNSHILDVGTGSGVLAIAAVLLGACSVDAIDIDPQAVTVAQENAVLNGVAKAIHCSTTPLQVMAGGYGLVLANILAEELVRLHQPLCDQLARGGYLILSGILREREAFVIEGFSHSGLIHQTSAYDGDWCCIVYQAPTGA